MANLVLSHRTIENGYRYLILSFYTTPSTLNEISLIKKLARLCVNLATFILFSNHRRCIINF